MCKSSFKLNTPEVCIRVWCSVLDSICHITDCGSDGYFQGTGGTLKLERTGSGNYDCLWVVKTLPGYNAVRVIVKKFKAFGKLVFIFSIILFKHSTWLLECWQYNIGSFQLIMPWSHIHGGPPFKRYGFILTLSVTICCGELLYVL